MVDNMIKTYENQYKESFLQIYELQQRFNDSSSVSQTVD